MTLIQIIQNIILSCNRWWQGKENDLKIKKTILHIRNFFRTLLKRNMWDLKHSLQMRLATLKYFSAAHINNTIRCMRFSWNSGSKQAFIWNCPLPCREWIEGEQSFTYKSEKQMMQFQNQTKFYFTSPSYRINEVHQLPNYTSVNLFSDSGT